MTNPTTNNSTVLVDEHGDIVDGIADLDELAQPAGYVPAISPDEALEGTDYVVMCHEDFGDRTYCSGTFSTEESARLFVQRVECGGRQHTVCRLEHDMTTDATTRENQRLIERLAAENKRLRERIQQVEDESQDDMAVYVQRAEEEMSELRREISTWRDMFGCLVRYVAQGVEDADEGGFNGEFHAFSVAQAFAQGLMAKANVDEGMFD